MSKMAELVKKNGKFVMQYNGEKLCASSNRDVVIEHWITRNKTVKLGITDPSMFVDKTDDNGEIGSGVGHDDSISKFSINQRFEFMKDLVDLVVDGATPSMIITGEPGWSKSHTVQEALQAAKLREHSDYAIVKGFSTPKGLYRILYENQDQLIIFDDCDTVLSDPTSLNLLKSALDSYDKRIIHWHSEKETDLPTSFEFRGRVIFISNKSKNKMNQAMISRSFLVDVSMSKTEKIDRLNSLIDDSDIGGNVPVNMKKDVLDLMVENFDDAPDWSIRTFLRGLKLRSALEGTGKSWENLVIYSIIN